MKRTPLILLLAASVCAALAACCSWRQPDGENSAEAEEVPHPDTLTLVFGGDMMLHTAQLQAAHARWVRQHGSAPANDPASYDYTPFLEEIRGRFQAADYAVVNMEFPLGGSPYAGYPAFSAPESYADYARDCGINVFLTANNHVFDRGTRGFRRTLDHYDRLDGVRYTGCGRDSADLAARNPLILEKGGLRVALVNFTYGTNLGSSESWPAVLRMKRESVGAAIDRAKQAGAHYIIALPHWGEEYVLTHNAIQADWARWLADRGADAVIGSHPHVVQDSCRLTAGPDSAARKVPVVYSLGNLVSNMSATNTQLELLATLRLVRTEDGAVRDSLSLEYLWCTRPGALCDSYRTVSVKENRDSAARWKNAWDHQKMLTSYERVKRVTRLID